MIKTSTELNIEDFKRNTYEPLKILTLHLSENETIRATILEVEPSPSRSWACRLTVRTDHAKSPGVFTLKVFRFNELYYVRKPGDPDYCKYDSDGYSVHEEMSEDEETSEDEEISEDDETSENEDMNEGEDEAAQAMQFSWDSNTQT